MNWPSTGWKFGIGRLDVDQAGVVVGVQRRRGLVRQPDVRGDRPRASRRRRCTAGCGGAARLPCRSAAGGRGRPAERAAGRCCSTMAARSSRCLGACPAEGCWRPPSSAPAVVGAVAAEQYDASDRRGDDHDSDDRCRWSGCVSGRPACAGSPRARCAPVPCARPSSAVLDPCSPRWGSPIAGTVGMPTCERVPNAFCVHQGTTCLADCAAPGRFLCSRCLPRVAGPDTGRRSEGGGAVWRRPLQARPSRCRTRRARAGSTASSRSRSAVPRCARRSSPGSRPG